jgi:hypothetical protein
MEIVWAHEVSKHTHKPVLILTPLAVAAQFVKEGDRFGLPVFKATSQSSVQSGVYVTNYDKMDRFDLEAFGGIVLDESSIIKSQDGKTRQALVDGCRTIPFRLAATATPAPNDYMELGNHAAFLGVMSYAEMLAMFFTHDGGDTSKWRLKGHAQGDFWKWMCSWAVMLTSPADLGYDGSMHVLPKLNTHEHIVDVEYRSSIETGQLFPAEARTLMERIGARRDTIAERVAHAANVINNSSETWVAWCNLNAETDALIKAIPDAVGVNGADSEKVKEDRLGLFTEGKIRVLVTKPSVCGFGMNWQHCHNTAFVGLNDSFEQVFQAIRRFWRFGQKSEVDVHFIAAETEGAVVANLKRKEADANRMIREMIANTADIASKEIKGMTRDKAGYVPTTMGMPSFLGGKN